MKSNHFSRLACLTVFAVSTAWSADLQQNEVSSRNRFSLSFDAGFNVRADFRNLNPDIFAPPATGSGLTGDPVDRTYDDGYNRVDFFDNGGGLTWNWGYTDPSQYDGATTVAMHATTRSGYGASTSASDDPQLGFELKYGRVIGTLGKNKPWGFEVAFGYMYLSIHSGGSMSSVQRVTDTYDTGLPLLPEYVDPPYQGTFNGPGPLIDDLPTRSVENASISGGNQLDGNLFALRLGPFIEIPLSVRLTSSGWTNSSAPSKFSAQVGAGLSLIYADTDFSYSETATFADGSTLSDSASDSSSDALVGGYVQGQLGYLFNESWSAFGGVRFETASSLTATAGNREAELDLGATFHAFFGVGYSF